MKLRSSFQRLLVFMASLSLASAQLETPDLTALRPQIPESVEYGDTPPASGQLMRPLMPGEPDSSEADFLDDGVGALAPVDDPNLEDYPLLEGESGPDEQEATRRLWRLVPIVSLSFVYDDNLFLRNTDREGDLIFTLNAGFAFELGDFREREKNYLALSYVGSAVFYNEFSSLNSYNPRLDLLARYRSEPITVELESLAFYLRGVQRQVGGFTTQTGLANTLTVSYDYSEKTSLDLKLRQRANVYPDGISSYYYDAALGADYALTSKLSVGLEGILGVAEAEGSPLMYYQIANLRLNYEATDKVALNLTGGLEFDQYATGGEAPRILPVFGLGGEYRPFSGTSFSLVGFRNVEASPSLARQDYIATGFDLGIRQAVGRRFTLGLALGYENDTYVSNSSAVSATRVDNYVYARPSISYEFLKYLTAKVFYEYRTNDSTRESNTWYDNRLGVELSASF